MRVMHRSRGLPLISAEQEPHLPALQFHRTARSGACSAWMAWTASRTTMPSPAATSYSFRPPASRVPRYSRNLRCVATSGPFLDELHEVGGDVRLALAPHGHTAAFLLNNNLLARLGFVRFGEVGAGVPAPALRTLQRRARRRFGHDQQRGEIDGGVPAGIVFAAARDPYLAGPDFQLVELLERGLEPGALARDSGVALHHRLKRGLHGVRILAAVALEGRERLAHRGVDLGVGNRRRRRPLRRGM